MPPKGKGKRAADDNSLAPLSTLLARASRATLEELLQKYHDEGHVNVRVDLSSRLAPEQARATRARFTLSALTVAVQRKKVHEGHRVKADASLVPDSPFSVRRPAALRSPVQAFHFAAAGCGGDAAHPVVVRHEGTACHS